MTDIELLPLPPKQVLDLHIPSGVRFYGYSNESMQHYARSNVEHHIAAKDAEIEALRAEVAAWRELSDHVRAGACNAIWPDRYTDVRTRDVAAALKRAERMAEAFRETERRMPQDQAGPAWIARTLAREAITADLRDHDKEKKDG